MSILVANTGSSSLKLRLIAPSGEVAAACDLPAPGDPVELEPMSDFLEGARTSRRWGTGWCTAAASSWSRWCSTAPASAPRRARRPGAAPQRPGAAGAGGAPALCPDVPHVACFDTAFHAGIPDEAALYALPRDWTERFGLRRFGFHGISHAWASRRAAEMLGREQAGLRLVTCHLGAGASLAAVRDGGSVDTTMGFTPNEGLVMATRSGSVDPGMLLWLIRHAGIRPTSSSRPGARVGTARALGHLGRHARGDRGFGRTTTRRAPRSASTSIAFARDRRHGRGDGRAGRSGVHRRSG